MLHQFLRKQIGMEKPSNFRPIAVAFIIIQCLDPCKVVKQYPDEPESERGGIANN